MKVLVTGAGGRVGRIITQDLTRAGHDVIGFDMGEKPDGDSSVAWIQGDILSADDLGAALTGCEGVIHMAAVPLHIDGAEVDTARTNILGTVTVFDQAMRAGVRRVVAASSICAAGLITSVGADRPTRLPVDEQFDGMPDDMYGISKRFGEYLAQAYGRRHDLSVVNLRIASVNFPDDPVFSQFMEKVFSDESDGDKLMEDIRWQYVDARDVAQAVRLALTTPGASGVYNVGAADTPGDDWRTWARSSFGHVLPKAVDPDLAADPSRPLWSISRAERELGYAPNHSWRDYPAVVAGAQQAIKRLSRSDHVTTPIKEQ